MAINVFRYKRLVPLLAGLLLVSGIAQAQDEPEWTCYQSFAPGDLENLLATAFGGQGDDDLTEAVDILTEEEFRQAIDFIAGSCYFEYKALIHSAVGGGIVPEVSSNLHIYDGDEPVVRTEFEGGSGLAALYYVNSQTLFAEGGSYGDTPVPVGSLSDYSDFIENGILDPGAGAAYAVPYLPDGLYTQSSVRFFDDMAMALDQELQIEETIGTVIPGEEANVVSTFTFIGESGETLQTQEYELQFQYDFGMGGSYSIGTTTDLTIDTPGFPLQQQTIEEVTDPAFAFTDFVSTGTKSFAKSTDGTRTITDILPAPGSTTTDFSTDAVLTKIFATGKDLELGGESFDVYFSAQVYDGGFTISTIDQASSISLGNIVYGYSPNPTAGPDGDPNLFNKNIERSQSLSVFQLPEIQPLVTTTVDGESTEAVISGGIAVYGLDGSANMFYQQTTAEVGDNFQVNFGIQVPESWWGEPVDVFISAETSDPPQVYLIGANFEISPIQLNPGLRYANHTLQADNQFNLSGGIDIPVTEDLEGQELEFRIGFEYDGNFLRNLEPLSLNISYSE